MVVRKKNKMLKLNLIAASILGMGSMLNASAQVAFSGSTQLIGDIYSTAVPTGGVTPVANTSQTYTYNFTATTTGALQLYFRQDPSFWIVSSVTLTSGGGANLLTNGNFTGGGTLHNGINVPAGWVTIGVQGLGSAGTLSGNTWVGGAVGGFDGLAQNVVVAGHTYRLVLVASNSSFTNNQGTTLLASAGNITELLIAAGVLPAGITVSGGTLVTLVTTPTVTTAVQVMGNSPARGAATQLDNIINANPAGTISLLFQPLTTNQQLSAAVSQTLPLMTGGMAIATSGNLHGINK